MFIYCSGKLYDVNVNILVCKEHSLFETTNCAFVLDHCMLCHYTRSLTVHNGFWVYNTCETLTMMPERMASIQLLIYETPI